MYNDLSLRKRGFYGEGVPADGQLGRSQITHTFNNSSYKRLLKPHDTVLDQTKKGQSAEYHDFSTMVSKPTQFNASFGQHCNYAADMINDFLRCMSARKLSLYTGFKRKFSFSYFRKNFAKSCLRFSRKKLTKSK
jgi:hypothetical protein